MFWDDKFRLHVIFSLHWVNSAWWNFHNISKKVCYWCFEEVEDENLKPIYSWIEGKLKLKNDSKRRIILAYHKSLIESLRYSITTRPNIVFGVGLLNKFME